MHAFQVAIGVMCMVDLGLGLFSWRKRHVSVRS